MNIGPARDATKSDTPNAFFSWVMVTGTAGSVVYNTVGGNTETITSLPAGVWTPVGNATNIRISSTATGLVIA